MGPLLKNFVIVFVLFILAIMTAKAEELDNLLDAAVIQDVDDTAERYIASASRAPAVVAPEETLYDDSYDNTNTPANATQEYYSEDDAGAYYSKNSVDDENSSDSREDAYPDDNAYEAD